MTTINDLWKSIEDEQKKFDELKLGEMKDYEKFYIYSVIAHSTAIEGSALSERMHSCCSTKGSRKRGILRTI
jgi:hypothetical protein